MNEILVLSMMLCMAIVVVGITAVFVGVAVYVTYHMLKSLWE